MRNTLSLVALLAIAPAASAETSGRGGLTCAVSVLQSCDEIEGCARISHADANVPRFFHVDLQKREIHGVRPDGSEAHSKIATVIDGETRLTLQGYDTGRAWSATIGDDGTLAIAATGTELVMTGFGACEPK